jgi:hypothetical protein
MDIDERTGHGQNGDHGDRPDDPPAQLPTAIGSILGGHGHLRALFSGSFWTLVGTANDRPVPDYERECDADLNARRGSPDNQL